LIGEPQGNRARSLYDLNANDTGLRRDQQERVVAPASLLLPCAILLGTGVSDRALPRVLVSIEELALTLAFPVSAPPGLIEGPASHGR